MTPMKAFLAGLLVLCALFVGSASGVKASANLGMPSFIPHFGGNPTPRAAKAANATTDFTCGAITCEAYEAGVNGYLQDVAADSGGSNNVYSVATEYTDSGPGVLSPGPVAYNESFAGTFVDTRGFPANGCSTNAASVCLSESQLMAEINTDMTKNGWTTSAPPLRNMFIILLPSGVDTCFAAGICASNTFCAYHDNSGNVGADLIFAVEPFGADYFCSGANEPTNPQGFPNGLEIDETVNTISHEVNEMVTDPEGGTGWTSTPGNENGDLCAWWFGSPLGTTGGQPYNQVINGHFYSLQQEFSNTANANAGGCQQRVGGTASSASPYVGNDTGPLHYGGGLVMHSVNVYTIFWIPKPAPTISVAPTVAGTPAVTQQLSTTDGTWTNSPTSYQYKWQRCNAAGASCVNIANATSSVYTLVGADAGHKIRSAVLASNVNGPAFAYAPSAPTSVVLPKPVLAKLPKVSGSAHVGNSLSVSTGNWKNSPTGFAYQWLRCNSLGMSCKKILDATSSTYLLLSTDVGHRFQAKVTATNGAGSATATSANKSAVVKT